MYLKMTFFIIRKCLILVLSGCSHCSVGYFFSWMVKAAPHPQHMASQLRYLNCSSTLPESKLPENRNASTCIFPAHCAFPGFTVPAFLSPKMERTDEVQGFFQYPNSELLLKETHDRGAMCNADPLSLQKKLLIFDHSGNKTRVFFTPVFPLDKSPVSAATEFTQACDVNEGQKINMGQNSSEYSLPEEYDENHIVNEESEMHEDTEEINALLYSDDDDEVMSTGRSPLPTDMIYLMQEHSEDMKEEIRNSNSPSKRQKLNDGEPKRSSPMDSVSSVRLNEACEYVSDAESSYVSERMCSAGKTIKVNSMMDDVQTKKDKICESLRVLENLIPGPKGKQSLLVIDGTIENFDI